MHFSDNLIERATRLKKLGLPWKPEVGHYVYDANRIVKPTSPFQAHVYFLLNYDCFMERVKGVERFTQNMVWLPAYEQARELLRRLGLGDAELQQRFMAADVIANGQELETLYKLIEEQLESVQDELAVNTSR